jgi:hypothetical protein
MQHFKNTNSNQKLVTSCSLEALTRLLAPYGSTFGLGALVPGHPLPQAGEGKKLGTQLVKETNSLLPTSGEGSGMRVEA